MPAARGGPARNGPETRATVRIGDPVNYRQLKKLANEYLRWLYNDDQHSNSLCRYGGDIVKWVDERKDAHFKFQNHCCHHFDRLVAALQEVVDAADDHSEKGGWKRLDPLLRNQREALERAGRVKA